ncbi:MAG TPA: response regulator [Candidatus Dorea intestinavium]|nr:response regulator [Candidatus Dorea intestinavium]
MYKVVLIDDEPIILEGMSKGFDWKKYDAQVVGTAEDGNEGIEVIRQKHPDIVFTDISMPNMDGLTMLAALKSEFPKLQVSILTGYRNFDYAQKAIRLGITRFLTKPSKMDELNEAMEVMTKKLKETNAKMETGAEEEGVANNFIVQNALTYIDAHYKEKLKLSDVADQVYVSQWHLSKLLNRHTGKSFSDILNQKRIEEAKELLKDPFYRIGDIAQETGFMDIAHFSRVFKKMVGVSANEYRNQKKNN